MNATMTMKFLLTAIPLLTTAISAFTIPSTRINSNRIIIHKNQSPLISPSRTTTNLKMSEEAAAATTQPDVSSYMAGPTPDGTEDFIMQQTMMRVKDPKKSLDFYCNVLGMKLIHYSEVSTENNA